MVTADLSQLSAECSTWRAQMRRYRDEITSLKNQLRQIALKATRREQLQDVEHYENQFHIQLINIHDLKQSIKQHDLRSSGAVVAETGRVNYTMLAEHEQLHAEYLRLQSLLDDLKAKFNQFIARLN